MRRLVFLLSALFLVSPPAMAQLLKEDPHRKAWDESLMDDNRAISEWFDGMAEGLDLFLAGKKYSERKNDTRFEVETGLFYSEKTAFSDATSFNLNLRLPNVEEYWHLTFSSYDETKERSATQTYLRQEARERNYGARVGFFKKLGNIRTSFQPRLGFAGRFQISHSLTFESVAERPNGYRVNPKLEFYADAAEGAGIFSSFNFNFHLSHNLSLTFINEGDYKDRSHQFAVTNGVSLGQRFSATKLMNYGVFFNFSNEPNYQLAEYILQPSWNHMLYKNMFGYEVVPYLNFNRDFDYAGYYGIMTYLRFYF
ncbi:hypothetical protein AZI86_01430 [Bdellovibrio bacteriovorus]|uniref:Uncharacterized protein n=1 Tax=Bdellovibrio bacteriovorus TaxID=959 RepID=A0A150WN14_BDEBC|nr:hypothetical protein [Bdellovibrio bacteriovorus]KYG65766.1 hypothetical protein AZI86_01430 [Bdellovibrio bacteriovorus]